MIKIQKNECFWTKIYTTGKKFYMPGGTDKSHLWVPPLQKIFLAENFCRMWGVPPPSPFFGKKIRKIVFERLFLCASKNALMHLQKSCDSCACATPKNVKKVIVALVHLWKRRRCACISRKKCISKKIKKNIPTCNLQGQLATPDRKNSSVKPQRTKRWSSFPVWSQYVWQ